MYTVYGIMLLAGFLISDCMEQGGLQAVERHSHEAFSILVADDDASICKLIKQILVSDGMQVTTAQDINEAIREATSHHYDLIMLDVMFAGSNIDGFQAIEVLRTKGVDAPLFVISALAEESSKVFGLSVGADDYITKPFSALELLYRVKATLRRYSNSVSQDGIIRTPPFTYYTNEMKLLKEDSNGTQTEIILSTKESKLMSFFMKHVNWVVTTDQIYESVWGNSITDVNTVMVHISKLRNKIEDDPRSPKYIKTIRGLGYQFTVAKN